MRILPFCERTYESHETSKKYFLDTGKISENHMKFGQHNKNFVSYYLVNKHPITTEKDS